jgi:TonB family protein
LQPILPWSGSQPEDLRFWRILGSVLTLFLVGGVIVPYLRAPQPELDLQPEMPVRLAQIIAEPVALSPAPVALARPRPAAAPPQTRPQKAPATAPAQAPTKAPEKAPQAPARSAAPPRREVAKTGLLALSDALDTMRRSTPKISASVPVPGRDASVGQAPAKRTGALTTGVTKGSGGIGVGTPSLQQVLGATGSPLGDVAAGRRRGDVGDRTGIRAAQDTPGGRRGKVRTEEEIQEILDRNKRAIYSIYNRELLADPGLHGKVVASITIAPSGKVTDCRIVYSNLGARSFEKELVALIRRIDFGNKPGVPVVTTRVPIEFFPT